MAKRIIKVLMVLYIIVACVGAYAINACVWTATMPEERFLGVWLTFVLLISIIFSLAIIVASCVNEKTNKDLKRFFSKRNGESK